MSSSCIEEVSLDDNPWYRIVQEMLSQANIEINGSRPWDIQITNPVFLNAFCRKDRWG